MDYPLLFSLIMFIEIKSKTVIINNVINHTILYVVYNVLVENYSNLTILKKNNFYRKQYGKVRFYVPISIDTELLVKVYLVH